MSILHNVIDNPAMPDDWILANPAARDSGTLAGVQALVEKRATVAKHRRAMASLSLDGRIEYLAEHGFDDGNIRELLGKIQRIINRDYGVTIRQIAAKHAQQGNSLTDVINDVVKTSIIQNLTDACYRSGGEKDVIAAAYANHELYYTVNAALKVAAMSGEPLAGCTTSGDPQGTARDQMLADVGLAEDAKLWPRS